MPFDTYEGSIEDGRPIYLYRFSLNDKVWRYTSADATIIRGGFVYTAIAISDEGLNQTGEAASDALRISMSTKAVPAQLYMSYPPARPVQVAILQTHEGDEDVIAIYQGEITQMNVPVPGTALATCETLSSTMQREGLRLGWQRGCPYALYDPVTCKLDKTAFGVAANVLAVSENVVAINVDPMGLSRSLSGGFIEWTDPVRGIERRGIEAHGTNAIAMFGTADGITPGLAITMYPGCARNTDACASFNNLQHYGGVPSFQGVSPFDGNPVFY